MKKIVLLFLLAGLLMDCNFDSLQTLNYSINEPVFISGTEFRNSVKVTDNVHELSNYGKICFYKGYIYISDPGKGIYIVNNRNPSKPQMTGYIELTGNYDLTIRNDLLYADAWIDLVWFDISNPSLPVPAGRIENIFPNAFPVTQNGYDYDYELCRAGMEEGKIVVGWELKERKQKISSDKRENALFQMQSSSVSDAVTGSMSRFSLYDKYLYAVINNQMNIIDLSDENSPKPAGNIYIGYNVETIFPYQDKMFMGTPTGLLIYSVENPLQPTMRSQISHVYGCDPVVVENDLAYVTIHSGNLCGQTSNELMIIDVSNIDEPVRIASYNMHNPKGLGIDNKTLFLCDAGLKIFKVTDPQTLISNLLKHYTGMDGYDVIPYDNTLIMISDNGLYQYDYSDLNNIRELSFIPVKK
ncbi:MAG: hypothetical protein LBG15_15245 [Dysgonamonadaceae bacterium]|jgi:hypothetical protein|nr:hypothetical protein [Dysgonamonadaceae bacterium]